MQCVAVTATMTVVITTITAAAATTIIIVLAAAQGEILVTKVGMFNIKLEIIKII